MGRAGCSGRQELRYAHAYYYQVQLQMGVCEVQWGYFGVWTPLGLYTENIVFDATFFCHCCETYTLHRHYLLPEFFLMKLPRRLPFAYV